MTSPTEVTAGVAAEKAALRAAAASRRDALHAAAQAAGNDIARLIARRFLDTWTPSPGTVVSAFWPIRSELDLRVLMAELHDHGCEIGLPVTRGRLTALEFRKWAPDTELEFGKFGVSTPPASAPVVEPDWLLVPLLAFDAAGYRLGYGGGFYDITLAGLRARKAVRAIGVAYDGQEVDTVPRDANDARLDAILTEQRALIMEP